MLMALKVGLVEGHADESKRQNRAPTPARTFVFWQAACFAPRSSLLCSKSHPATVKSSYTRLAFRQDDTLLFIMPPMRAAPLPVPVNLAFHAQRPQPAPYFTCANQIHKGLQQARWGVRVQ